MEDVEIDEECIACGSVYRIAFDENELRGDAIENTTRHCTFCGILMEPYYDDEEI